MSARKHSVNSPDTRWESSLGTRCDQLALLGAEMLADFDPSPRAMFNRPYSAELAFETLSGAVATLGSFGWRWYRTLLALSAGERGG